MGNKTPCNKTPSFEGENYNEFLDSPLTEEELLFVIRNLKTKSIKPGIR